MISIPFFLTLYAGFTHAFETDHILAVSNIVSNRKNIKLSLKDGAFWGFGHTSTIVFIGIIMLLLKVNISDQTFQYFESAVGLMLIILGVFRLSKIIKEKKKLQYTIIHISIKKAASANTCMYILAKMKNTYTHTNLLMALGLYMGLQVVGH
jgi:high-affinity nickel permease